MDNEPNFRQVIVEESARELRGMFIALVNAGFNDDQALELTSAYFIALAGAR